MNVTPVDGHVHFHPCFTLPNFLHSAIANFSSMANAPAALPQSPCGVLLLTQIGERDPLQPMLEQASLYREWTTQQLDDEAVLFSRQGVPSVIIIAGRQIVTAEGLELLSLCTRSPQASHHSLQDSVEASVTAGGIPVLPWGFGKWWFSRGRIVRGFLASHAHSNVLIGDNGGRMRVMHGEVIKNQQIRGSQILAGSDPLPLPNHVTRVASFGTLLPGKIDLSAPTAWIRQTLRETTTDWKEFGRCRRPRQFFADQLMLLMEKMRHDNH